MTTWASTGAGALAQPFFGTGNVVSYNHRLSADGKFVAYEAVTNAPVSPHGRGIILRYSLDTGVTDLVNTNAAGPAAPYEDARSLDITPDGRFIAFVANMNDIVGSTICILLWDGNTGDTTLVSGDLSNSVPPNSVCDSPAMDQSGRYVAFISNVPNLVTNSLVGEYHLYVRDVQAGVTTLVDAGADGIGTAVSPATVPRLSADGRLVAFESPDANLAPGDRNRDYDLFLRDLSSNTVEYVSARHAALPSLSPNGPSAITAFSVSTDGRDVAFSSDADNLVANDTNAMRDIFVRDLFTGTNVLVSIGMNGVAADGISSEPAISGDGRYVVFTSSADNLVAGDANNAQDVFCRDLQTGTTTLISLNSSGTGPGNGASYSPSIGADGRWVLFRSSAANLATGQFSGTENLFVRDRQLAKTYAVTKTGVGVATVTPDGRFVAFGGTNANIYLWDAQSGVQVWSYGTTAASILAITTNGSRIAWDTNNTVEIVDRSGGYGGPMRQVAAGYPRARARLKFSGDGRFLTYALAPSSTGNNQAYLYDFQTGTSSLVSHVFGSTIPASGASDSLDISADGRFVAYRSTATNLLSTATTTNFIPNLFLYDRLSGTNIALTASRYSGLPADNWSLSPIFSGAGRTPVFQSWASDIAAQDFNRGSDVFALAFLYASIAGQPATLTWPARPGETYHVQFKNSLGDSSWQEVSGTVTITNGQAHLTDLAPAIGQRFYRIAVY
jgi:Tol biopolymer transport system component